MKTLLEKLAVNAIASRDKNAHCESLEGGRNCKIEGN
jgi:hypothetical protein